MESLRWTEAEFAVLLAGTSGVAEPQAVTVQGRSSGAIGHVARAVHTYHSTGVNRSLSIRQRTYIDRHVGSLTCPWCGARF